MEPATLTSWHMSHMKTLAMKVIIPAIVLIFIVSCTDRTFDDVPPMIEASVPIYADTTHPPPVVMEASRPVSNSGKIYVYGNYIFQNELYEGIHIIDNTDRLHPVKKAFLAIPFNTEMAIKGDHLYANSISDLLVISLADPLHPSVVNTIKHAFPFVVESFPPDGGYFVCPDPSKGVVVGWKKGQVEKANCRR
jgi:hypothetical protein